MRLRSAGIAAVTQQLIIDHPELAPVVMPSVDARMAVRIRAAADVLGTAGSSYGEAALRRARRAADVAELHYLHGLDAGGGVRTL